jgi:hypothetical protein
MHLSIILPQTDLVPVWVFKGTEYACVLAHGRTGANTLGPQFFTPVPRPSKLTFVRGSHDFKQNPVDAR